METTKCKVCNNDCIRFLGVWVHANIKPALEKDRPLNVEVIQLAHTPITTSIIHLDRVLK